MAFAEQLGAPPYPRPTLPSAKIYTTLITNTAYLTGLLTLDYSMRKHGAKYPLVALYTDTFPEEGLRALQRRGIAMLRIQYMLPTSVRDYSNDPRFYDCWSKLAPFGLTSYERIVQLDSDMLLLKNMDDLMDLALDPPEMEGQGSKVFAAGHACTCNPLKKSHYPASWVPETCAFTAQHADPETAQLHGGDTQLSHGMPNGGLQVVNPSTAIFDMIMDKLTDEKAIQSYDFADQSMLGDIFNGRWVPLSYTRNALKTLRECHRPIWQDDSVMNIHYILSPKPWDEKPGQESQETHKWWHKYNSERLAEEKTVGIDDGF